MEFYRYFAKILAVIETLEFCRKKKKRDSGGRKIIGSNYRKLNGMDWL